MAYNWIKVLHVVAIISWRPYALFAATVCVPCRPTGGFTAKRDAQGHGAALAEIHHEPGHDRGLLTGLWLAYSAAFWSQGWLHGKLAAGIAAKWGCMGFWRLKVRRRAGDERRYSQKFYRITMRYRQS